MVKRLLFFATALLFFQVSEVFAQISMVTIDPGPYTPGSSIAATFTIESTCIRPGNRFDLYLVHPNGTEVAIGNFNGFYGTFVNGIIPIGTPALNGYRLRIKSTTPAMISDDSSPFAIQAGTPVLASIDSAPEIGFDAAGKAEVFGYCPGQDNVEFGFTNSSTASSVVTGTIKNEISGNFEAPLTFALNQPPPSFIAALAHYTVFITSKLNGTVGTRAYLIVNNTLNTSFGTSGKYIVCLPGGFLEYSVDLSERGIMYNFPGTTYQIKWGEGANTPEVFTKCDLATASVRHEYTSSSCGQPVYNTGNGEQFNVFGINISAVAPFCPGAGAGISTYVRVVRKPENSFTSLITACKGSTVSFENTSLAGEIETNFPNCIDNNVKYNWYVDNVKWAANVSRDFIFRHTFLDSKVYDIKLESVTTGTCKGVSVTKQICIQDPPQPVFDFNNVTQTGCGPFTIQAFDRSIIDARCNTDNSYNWIVNGPSGVQFDRTAKDPIFIFTNPGTYEVILEIQTASCGAVRTQIPQKIILVDGRPTAVLSGEQKLCGLGTFDFDNITTGPTKTLFSGTQQTIPNTTYTWYITENDGRPLSPSDYSFEGNTDLHSQYPKIKFNSYKTYKVEVVHVNSCATARDSQFITFLESPVPEIEVRANPICYNASADLTGKSSNSNYTGVKWTSSGGGSFSADNALITTYTPSPAEQTVKRATVTLTLSTGLSDNCEFTFVSKVIDIFPNNTGVNTTAEICTGERAVLFLNSTVPGSTFTWIATNTDGNASGYTTSGSAGNIDDLITNSSPTLNAIVEYTITPSANGCVGQPFTFTVTIGPKPVLDPVPEKTICENTTTSITVGSTIPSRFRWTSIASAGVTGNSNPPGLSTASTSITIDDVLFNSTFTQGRVTYTITPVSELGCEGAPIVVVVNVDPETVANAGPDDSICSSDNYLLKGNKPDVGNGRWKIISASSGNPNISIPTDHETTVTGLVSGGTYTFEWEITGAGVCRGTSDQVTIVVKMPTIPGTTAGAQTVCKNNNTGTITLTGQTGSILTWQSWPDGQTEWADIPGTSASSTYAFNNLAITTQFRAVVQNAGCRIEYSTPTTITVTPADTQADAGTNQTLCEELTVTLHANANTPLKAGETGLWTLIAANPANPPVEIKMPGSPTTVVEQLVAGQVYKFKWTITGPSACGPASDEVIIINNPQIQQNSIRTSSLVCNGQQVVIDGRTPTGGAGRLYSYSWETNTNGGMWAEIAGQTGEDLSVTLTTTGEIGFRRTVTSGGCTSLSNAFIITVQPPIENNTIAANQRICSGTAPAILTGTVPTGGDGQFRYQWQISTDDTAWTDIIGAQQSDYQAPLLTATVFYRRLVHTIACAGAFQDISNSIKITVDPNAEAAYTFNTDRSCAPFTLQISAASYPENGTYKWYANGTFLGDGITFPGYTIANSNDRVTIRLEVTSSLGCSDDDYTHDFTTNQAVPAAFTPISTTDCETLEVTFINESIQTAGARFRWNFGNGQTSPNANPQRITFQSDASGKDTTYVVTLYAITECGIDSAKGTVLVKSAPKPIFSPSTTSGCSPLPVNFTNNSPLQADIEYIFDFGDGSAVVRTTDRSTVTHIYRTTTNTQTFNATLTAVNQCGTVTTLPYAIVVRPNTVNAELVVNGNQLRGCAPFRVTFDNNSTGATDFTVDFKDGAQPRQSIIFPERFVHTFTAPGTYEVTLTATNGCSTDVTTETIVVLPQPITEFEADNTLGCPGLIVKFKNNTQNGVSYIWDFGDGSPISNEFEPTHTYTGDQEYYTVSLTATNTLGCTMLVGKNQYIHIVQPPIAAFNVNPSTLINIPDYTFRFEDGSTNTPTIWEWDFGDGTGSALKNPSHTYLDTGTYKVTLKVLNQQGCFTSTFKNVTIKGVPGYLFVPNSFAPGNTQPELREFRGKGSGIATWRFSIFNKWGQLLWETTKLEEGRPVEGWDGTFKSQQLPQGVYYWKVDVQMVNGSEWKGMTYDSSAPKRTGAIHLIR